MNHAIYDMLEDGFSISDIVMLKGDGFFAQACNIQRQRLAGVPTDAIVYRMMKRG